MNKEPNIYSFNDECYVYYGDYKKEIERLNNIINKLEKWLEEEVNKDWDFSTSERNAYDAYDDALNKLKELKEDK